MLRYARNIDREWSGPVQESSGAANADLQRQKTLNIVRNVGIDFSFNDLMQFGIFLIALLTFIHLISH